MSSEHDEIRASIADQLDAVLRRYEREPTTRGTMDAIRLELHRLTERIKREHGAPLTLLVDGVEREIINWRIEQPDPSKRAIHITPVVEVRDVE